MSSLMDVLGGGGPPAPPDTGPPPGGGDAGDTGGDGTYENSMQALDVAEHALKAFMELDHDAPDRAQASRALSIVASLKGANQSDAQSGGLETDPSEEWRSQVTPPYVLQTCEGMLATMLEPSPRFDVQPRPRPEEPLDEVIGRVHSVDAISDTLRYALDRDQFAQRQRSFMQQDMVAGISVLKSYWRTEQRDVTKLAAHSLAIVDSFGTQYDSVTVYQETQQEETMVVDDACCEVVDVRDFFWPSQS